LGAGNPKPRPITFIEIDVLNSLLSEAGIEIIRIGTADIPPPLPPPPPPDDKPPPNPTLNGDGAKSKGNGFDPSRGDYKHPDPADEPYAPIRIGLINRGYRLARSFDFALPDRTVLFTEDRYELADHVPATKARPRKTCRFRHSVNGMVYSGTGPRRIIYNWPP